MTRVPLLSLILAGLLVSFSATAASAQSPEADLLPDPQEMARVEASIDRALEYLAKVQMPNGSFPSSFGDNNAINAYCLLAFLGRGHEPGRGPYRDVVDRTVAHIRATQIPSGLYASVNASHGVMYEHGMATLAMIEAYGFIPTKEMRKSVQMAVDLLVKSQSPQGGWRYAPTPAAGADVSVTVMQCVALRAALNARLDVPQATVDKAVAYIKSCAVPTGGFGYTSAADGANPPRAGAGLLCLQLLGAVDDPAVIKTLEYMKSVPFGPASYGYFYYTVYYAMQAHFQAGGEHWARWHPTARKWFLDNQAANGTFPVTSETYGGPAMTFSTPIGAMCLEVYLHYLPAYQR